jgi:hypothetical protein
MLSTLQIHYITTLKCMKNKRTYLSNFSVTAFFSVYAKAKDDKIYMYIYVCMYIYAWIYVHIYVKICFSKCFYLFIYSTFYGTGDRTQSFMTTRQVLNHWAPSTAFFFSVFYFICHFYIYLHVYILFGPPLPSNPLQAKPVLPSCSLILLKKKHVQ